MIGPPAPRRLVLSAADLDALVRRTGVRLPPPFDAAGGDPQPGPVHPSLAANVAVLARPDLLVRMDARLPGGGSRAVFAVAGPLGASLFALVGGAVELSMFAAVSLGRELVRGVPEPPVHAPATLVHQSLAPSSPPSLTGSPWAGARMSRTALAEYGPARRLLGAGEAAATLGLDEAEADLVAELTDRTRGSLRVLVHAGRPRDGGVLVGRLVWVATDAGWVELEPSDVDSVRLLPVVRELIGTRLAPFVAEILEYQQEARHDAA
jgi:hypothetical protein